MAAQRTRLWLTVLLVGCAAVAGACTEGYTVLKEQDLDDVPVLIRASQEMFGYHANDVLLALVPAPLGKVRIPRGQAQILAVYDEGEQRFRRLTEAENRELAAVDWVYATSAATSAFGVVLPGSLGFPQNIADPANKLLWARAGAASAVISIEAAFQGSPQIIRKVSYKPAEDALSVDIENGAKLQVQLR